MFLIKKSRQTSRDDMTLITGFMIISTEAAVRSSKYVFLKVLQHSQENNCVGLSF